MAYTKQEWKDGAEGKTPINAERLNHMESGIADGQNAAAVNWSNLSGKPATFAPTIGKTATTAMAGNTSIPAAPTADTLSGATAVGKSVMKAADAAAARDAIGAGTSSLALGTTATTALKGDTAIPTIPATMSASEAEAGTATTQRTISAKVLHDLIAKMIADAAA